MNPSDAGRKVSLCASAMRPGKPPSIPTNREQKTITLHHTGPCGSGTAAHAHNHKGPRAGTSSQRQRGPIVVRLPLLVCPGVWVHGSQPMLCRRQPSHHQNRCFGILRMPLPYPFGAAWLGHGIHMLVADRHGHNKHQMGIPYPSRKSVRKGSMKEKKRV